jgi:hypothetical protein
VRITRELYDYALANGMLKYRDFASPATRLPAGMGGQGVSGTIKDIKLDTSKWLESEKSAMTFTLPF